MTRIAERPFDLILLDFALPERNGIEILQEIRERDADLPVIMITAYGTVENAVNAMQAGATNFIQKPWDNEKLLADVRTAVGRRRAEEEVVQLKRALKQRYNFEHIIGKSDPMLRIFDLVAQVAPSRSTILLQGESGTGKELIAKAIHMNSPRKDRAFVPVNTGSIPGELLESTLFGHVKGAFTSAIASKKGLFEVADRGTLFLDEIGTMSLETQAKILRVLAGPQVHAPRRHQRDSSRRSHHRRHQRRSPAAGEGRQVPRRSLLPPQRHHHRSSAAAPAQERHSHAGGTFHPEVLPRRTARPPLHITPEALRPLMDYDWPGNVRELENVIERAVVLATGPSLSLDLLPDNMARPRHHAIAFTDHRPDASLFEIIEETGTAGHRRHAGEVQLEPDRRRRAVPHSSVHSEPEDQAPQYRDQEARPGKRQRGLSLRPAVQVELAFKASV